ncbi:hypothetical protein [Macrococcoides canis]|uniref:hypothetical protein n=1 Tax=Macrococcoides canis TaxID=1855823 RepID=UPI00165DCFA9|nr:hypothetical protein [Macrococcus canis]QNR07808.1 hypothetical protein GL258_05895 [Macrococcus canis]
MIIKKGSFRMLECIDRMIDIIDFHPWIANLCGIFISAGVAIYVMNKNHEDSEKKIIQKEQREDEIEMSSATIIMGQILTISTTLYNTYKNAKIPELDKRDLIVVEMYLEELEKYSKELLKIKINFNDSEYVSLIKTSSGILNEVRSFQANYIIHNVANHQKVSAAPFYQCFKKIQNYSYDYLKDRQDYTMFKNTERI